MHFKGREPLQMKHRDASTARCDLGVTAAKAEKGRGHARETMGSRNRTWPIWLNAATT